jgi:hypothetical protein
MPRPISGESCMRFDAKTDGRGAVRSTGVSSCGGMPYGLEEGTSSGPIPLRYGDVGYAGGPHICHLGVVKTVSTLAPTRMPRDGVDAGSNGEISSWNIRSSAPAVVYMRTRSVVALLFRGVCGPFRLQLTAFLRPNVPRKLFVWPVKWGTFTRVRRGFASSRMVRVLPPRDPGPPRRRFFPPRHFPAVEDFNSSCNSDTSSVPTSSSTWPLPSTSHACQEDAGCLATPLYCYKPI